MPAAEGPDPFFAYGIANYYPFADMSANDHRLVRATYWAMCDQINEQVGRMMEALDRSGQREETLIVFMSDHGEMLGDHGLYLKDPYFRALGHEESTIATWLLDAGYHTAMFGKYINRYVPHRHGVPAVHHLLEIRRAFGPPAPGLGRCPL
jgi:arylsulfatase A-like enzyme